MTKKEGDSSPSPSRRDPRVFGPRQKTVIALGKLIRDKSQSEESPAQAQASIPTEGKEQQQTQ